MKFPRTRAGHGPRQAEPAAKGATAGYTRAAVFGRPFRVTPGQPATPTMKPARSVHFLLALVACAVALGVPAAPGDDLPADTSAIESLTPEQARRLAADFPGSDVEVTIMGSSKATFFRSLPLNGLKQLDADTAKALAGYRKETLILNGLTTIDADTARALAGFKGPRLVLNGLTGLDAAAAKQLAAFQGEWLGLSGLSSLDAETATALADSKSVRLDLSGLPTLDAAIAQTLAGFRGQMLVLNGLTTLDPATAEALAKYGEKGNHLGLCSLTTLDAATAKSLVKSKAWEGDVRRLTTLDAATAKSLAEFQGNDLQLSLPTLDADIAEALAEYTSCLHFSNLTSLDVAAAKALARFKGHFLAIDVNALDFDAAEALAEYKGLIGLGEEVIENLAADHPLSPRTALVYANLSNGVLPFLTAFESPDAVEIAKALATRKGRLALPNLEKISPKTLAALIAKKDVEIPPLEKLELIAEPDGSGNDDFVVP